MGNRNLNLAMSRQIVERPVPAILEAAPIQQWIGPPSAETLTKSILSECCQSIGWSLAEYMSNHSMLIANGAF